MAIEIFLSGLASGELLTVKNFAIGLRQIRKPVGIEAVLVALGALQQLPWDESTVSVRDQLFLFFGIETGEDFGYCPKTSGAVKQDVLGRISDWIQQNYPREFNKFKRGRSEQLRGFSERMETINWEQEDITRGEKVYQTLQCGRCHDTGSRLGPRLEGLRKRFSRNDLIRAIVFPSEQVPERYRALSIETVDGNFYSGAKIYESVDGITLRESNGKTVRVNRDQIEFTTNSNRSLMPDGLLDEVSDSDGRI